MSIYMIDMNNKNIKQLDICLDGKGALTQQIMRAISQSIMLGDLQTGDLLPSEMQLAKQFDISRQTVHKAMSAMAKDGILLRRKKAGTIVAEQKAFMLPMQDISADVAALNKAYSYKIGARETLINGDNGLNWQNVELGTEIECITCLHFADKQPIQLEIRMVNLLMAPDFANEDFCNISPSKWLFQQVPWSNVEHKISAIAASDDIANKLNCATSAPCLLIERSTSYKQQAITFTSLISVGSNLSLKGTHTPIA